MRKIFVFLRRKDGESLEDFKKRYLTDHANYILSHEWVERYTANLMEEVPPELVAVGYGTLDPDIDAVDQIWFSNTDIDPMPIYDGCDAKVLAAYEVEERLMRDMEITWPLGTRSPWLKRIAFLNRLPGTTKEFFSDYWLNNHGPLALKIHGAVVYIQDLVERTLTPDTPEWDGLVQLTYMNPDGWIHDHFPNPGDRDIIAEDVSHFIDGFGPGRKICLLGEYIFK